MSPVDLRTSSTPLIAWARAAMESLNARHPWSHNDHFHGWIVRHLPERRALALDVGCGEGALLDVLALHVDQVTGIDRSGPMVESARRRSAGSGNVVVREAVFDTEQGTYDVITMIAVLHHLDVRSALRQVRGMVRPGGRFLCVGLARIGPGLIDQGWDVLCAVTNPLIGIAKHPRAVRGEPAPSPVPVADPTVTYADLRRMVREELPGARMRRRLGFRHTIEWRAP